MALKSCHECGRQISTKAKSCPQCGAPRKTRNGRFELLVLTLVGVVFVGIIVPDDSRYARKSGRTSTPPASRSLDPKESKKETVADYVKNSQPSKEEIEEAIRYSDDFDTHRLEFVFASAILIRDGRCTLADLRENGGWVRSQSYGSRPVYFTYGGGLHVDNRIYLDVSTGDTFQ